MIEVKLVNAPKPKPRGLSGLLVKWGGFVKFSHTLFAISRHCSGSAPNFAAISRVIFMTASVMMVFISVVDILFLVAL